METEITANDLDPIVKHAIKTGKPAFIFFDGLKLSQVRQAFETAYGKEIADHHNAEYMRYAGYRECSKCGGTGKYAAYVLDGSLYSPTGTTCWKCNGSGWTKSKK